MKTSDLFGPTAALLINAIRVAHIDKETKLIRQKPISSLSRLEDDVWGLAISDLLRQKSSLPWPLQLLTNEDAKLAARN